MPAKILIVDDDPDIRSGLQGRLHLLGYDSVTAEDDGIKAYTGALPRFHLMPHPTLGC